MATIALQNSPSWNCHLRLKGAQSEKNRSTSSEEATHRAKDGDKSPQGGVTRSYARRHDRAGSMGSSDYPSLPVQAVC